MLYMNFYICLHAPFIGGMYIYIYLSIRKYYILVNIGKLSDGLLWLPHSTSCQPWAIIWVWFAKGWFTSHYNDWENYGICWGYDIKKNWRVGLQLVDPQLEMVNISKQSVFEPVGPAQIDLPPKWCSKKIGTLPFSNFAAGRGCWIPWTMRAAGVT